MWRGGLAALALTAIVSVAAAQPQPQPQPMPSGSDEVVVTAIRPEQMRNFVRQLGEPGKEDQLSRWDGKVCPGVVGLQPATAQALIDQIAMRAFAVGLDTGRPGCKANVLIIVTPDAQAFTPAFVDQNKRFFSFYENNGNALGREAIERFKRTQRPIRWWHVSQTVTENGQVIGEAQATGSDGFEGVPVAELSTASRLRSGLRETFNRVIIIIDSNAVAGRPFPAVADYVAMVALAQIRAEASHGNLDTILALFDPPQEGGAAPTGWTDWDRAYLVGLYAAHPFLRTSRQQANAIARRVEKESRAEQPRTPPPPR